ncbi:class I adenylate-forming enzyme family protein [Halorussus salinus]|uniref:class I adenylate-forming enzyme family protein n=1 Tax=Halorussus salinus TaxID=1364935 RepID=UPI001092E8C1|nr:AMP-binding protein [Halorussus salinus]
MTLSLERRAALWGDRLAVVDASADRRVSYADLESEADAMARRLSALGVGPGDPVAVVSRNRIETLALLFAVRRLGGIFAPVSYRLTPATVEEPLETIDPEVVVHEPAQRDLVRELPDERTHSFEELGRHEGEEYERADGASEGSDRDSGRTDRDAEESLLYLHTDPSDDREDGVRVVDYPARAVEWNCVTAAAGWGLGRDDCAPALLPFSDADGLLRFVLPLLYVGGRVALLRAFSPDDALATVAEEGATALFAGATEYRELVADETFGATDFAGVEWVAARSPLPADAREELARRAPVVRTYGRVETGPNALLVPPERGASAGGPGASERGGPDDADRVGRPFPDCEVRIANDEGMPVAEGEAGELRFRGAVTPRGYLGRDGEGATEEFPEWVPTGDLGYREGGDCYLLGPADERGADGERGSDDG